MKIWRKEERKKLFFHQPNSMEGDKSGSHKKKRNEGKRKGIFFKEKRQNK